MCGLSPLPQERFELLYDTEYLLYITYFKIIQFQISQRFPHMFPLLCLRWRAKIPSSQFSVNKVVIECLGAHGYELRHNEVEVKVPGHKGITTPLRIHTHKEKFRHNESQDFMLLTAHVPTSLTILRAC